MKLVFMGSPAFAVPSLRAVHASAHDVVEVVTQPDRPAGRGRRLRTSAIGEAASELGLGISKPERFRAADFVEHLESLGADAFVVVAFGHILRKRHLDIPPRGCVNVHPSLLPRHRGPVPIVGTLLAGDDVTGVSTMRIDAGVDTGDLYLQQAVEIHAGEDAGALHDRLADLGATLLVRTLDGIEAETLSPVPQEHERATVTGMLKKSDGLLDWERPAVQLYRRVRAMTPWPGAFTTRRASDGGDERLTIVRALLADDLPPRGRPGQVVDVSGDGPVIACGRGHLRVLRVKPAGSREMTGAALVRGHRVNGGEQWHA